jgi:hypothetical protein
VQARPASNRVPLDDSDVVAERLRCGEDRQHGITVEPGRT